MNSDVACYGGGGLGNLGGVEAAPVGPRALPFARPHAPAARGALPQAARARPKLSLSSGKG